jgi:hypothetical protein
MYDYSNLIALVVGSVFIIALFWACWALTASARQNKGIRDQYSAYMELSREGLRLQAESNSLMRELIAALREKS